MLIRFVLEERLIQGQESAVRGVAAGGSSRKFVLVSRERGKARGVHGDARFGGQGGKIARRATLFAVLFVSE
jgi:hypothetical protein